MTTSPVIGLIQFPGSNCERETRLAITRQGMQPKDIFWNNDTTLLSDCDGYVIIGGFSYEDRLRSGVIAALSPIISALKIEALKGKPVLGLCNGAQILMEAGMVPGLKSLQLGGALYTNKRQIEDKVVEGGYYNDWCDIKPLNISDSHAFTNQFKANQRINIPFAHAQGRFVIPEALLQEMIETNASMFQYAESNPNGSIYDLAAISNKAGNVMAMMPHPERTREGDLIFQSMRTYIESSPKIDTSDVYTYRHQVSPLSAYQPPTQTSSFLVELLIEDNTAKSLELVLKQHEFDVKVKRYQYVEIDSNGEVESTVKAIKESGEILNESKERVVELKNTAFSYLVVDKDDVLSKQKTDVLKNVFGITSLNSIKKAVLYTLDVTGGDSLSLIDFLKESHLLYNPYVQDCYEY
jgi:phosphoribosylformylglycinamidine synthase